MSVMVRIIHRIRELWHSRQLDPESSVDSTPVHSQSCLCVIANIRRDVPYGPGGTLTKQGHRRFSPGTKVYVLAPSWDWVSHGTFECVALRRRSHRFVSQVIDRKFLVSWRIKRVYNPNLVSVLARNRLGQGWSQSLAERVVEHESELAAGQR